MESPDAQADTARRLAAAIRAANERIDELEQRSREPIAIIGMACRVPGGADDPDTLWSLLSNGVDAVTPMPAERLELVKALGDTGFDHPSLADVHGGFVDGIEEFEPAFFGITEREARRMDPQQRMLLEVTWQALENAAIRPADLRSTRTGLYVGICFEDFAHRQTPEKMDVALSVGSSRSLGVGRVAYTLDLQGPVLQLDTTCSSSLLAIHLASHALRRGECEVALAGGVNALLAHEVFLAFTQMGALSRTGRCRTFDADGDGYVRGEGCAMVVLKPLSAAVADGDHVWAVIEGTAVNHDGRSNGLTAPNGSQQEAVIRDAVENSGLAPGDIQYLEAHGTGTPLGDPIEVAAATRVLCDARPADRPLHMGSIKSNVGHLEGAAGVAGVMKAALAIHHGRIPPSVHFRTPNERIAWDTVPVRVPTETIDWPDGPRHAGVSSFGMSGTNVHAVLGAAPARPEASITYDRPAHVLVLSARTDASLRAMAGRYADALARPGGPSIGDACFTANTTRQRFARQAAFVAADAATLADALRVFAGGATPGSCVLSECERPTTVAFDAPQADAAGMVRRLAELAGQDSVADWPAFYEGCGLRRVPLPGYAFDRKRLWLGDTAAPTPIAATNASIDDAMEALAPTSSPTPAVALEISVCPEELRAMLRGAIAEALDRPVDQIDEDAPLSQIGLDSLAAADVLITMERELGIPIADSIITENATIGSLADLIRGGERLEA